MNDYLITGKCVYLSIPITVMRNVTAKDGYSACLEFLGSYNYPIEITRVDCIAEHPAE